MKKKMEDSTSINTGARVRSATHFLALSFPTTVIWRYSCMTVFRSRKLAEGMRTQGA